MSHACCHYQGSDHILVTDVTSIPGARSKQPKNCKNLKKNVFRIKDSIEFESDQNHDNLDQVEGQGKALPTNE